MCFMCLTDLQRIVIFHKEDSQGLLSNTSSIMGIYLECQIGWEKTPTFNYYYKIVIKELGWLIST